MFEVGKLYKFRMVQGDNEIMFWGVVETYEHPLVQLQDTGPITIRVVGVDSDEPVEEESISGPFPGRIINVTSPNFIGAVMD
jgi:hypothetical protein